MGKAYTRFQIVTREYYLPGESPEKWIRRVLLHIQPKKKKTPVEVIDSVINLQQRRGLNPQKAEGLPEGVAGFHLSENSPPWHMVYLMGVMMSDDGKYLITRNLNLRAPGRNDEHLRAINAEQRHVMLAELMKMTLPQIKYTLPEDK